MSILVIQYYCFIKESFKLFCVNASVHYYCCRLFHGVICHKLSVPGRHLGCLQFWSLKKITVRHTVICAPDAGKYQLLLRIY